MRGEGGGGLFYKFRDSEVGWQTTISIKGCLSYDRAGDVEIEGVVGSNQAGGML